jgi:aspartyl-tRNA(Asn)/glutamyl-tRNA(Gln) amidotransferase subunit C
MTTKVTTDDVERVAELAHLKLTPEETTGMQRDLNAILDYIAELNELDTKDAVPLAQISELADAGPSAPRPDAAVPSLPRELVMQEAPETNGAFFKVPKVIER